MKAAYLVLLWAIAFPIGTCSGDVSGRVRELVLFDFEANGGTLNLGGEFPGAKGQFTVVADAAHDGQRGGRLSFDLTGGNYVACSYALPRRLVEGARSISVWVRVGTEGHQVHCKTRDGTGQEHIRFSAAPPPGEWQRVSFDVDDVDGHWGGANDGKIHWPITLVQIGVEARGEKKVSHMDIDTLSVHTTASADIQPGALLEVDCPQFGHLFERAETARFTLRAGGTEQRPAQRFQGQYSVCDWMDREMFLRDLCGELREVSRKHGGPERVVVTESGWTTYEGEMEYLKIAGGYPRSSYAHQAQYIIRMFLTSQAAGAEHAIQYDFRNDGGRRTHTEHNFGLVHEDYSLKPSLIAVAAMTRILGQGRFVKDLSPDPDKARAYLFDVNGKPVVAAYAIQHDASLSLKTGAEKLELADLMGNRQRLAAPGGVVTLSLAEAPVYLLGAARELLKEPQRTH